MPVAAKPSGHYRVEVRSFDANAKPWQTFVLARDFDGIAMIDSTTPARPR